MDILPPTPWPHPSDRELLPGLHAGEEAAFRAFVRRFCDPMYYVALRLLGNAEDTREVVQEAFFNAFRGLPDFDEHSRLSTWLHRIVVNAALRFLEKRAKTPQHSIEALLPHFTDGEHHTVEPRAPEIGVEEILAKRELHAAVHRCIAELPEIYRTVVLLRDIEGYSTAAAAELLAITEMVVKTRLHRGRQALRTLLEPEFREGRHELP